VGRKIFLIFALVVIAVLVGANVYINRKGLTVSQTSLAPQTKTVIPPVEASDIKSVDSPDGKKTLSMRITKNQSGVTYAFSVSGKEIFAKTVDPTVSFSIPLNSWSPDNKYVFLKETAATGVKFFVLSASDDSSSQNDQTANITDLFAKKYPDLKIKDVTGWGGINLVIVNSDSSFWFEMPTHSFIQLSTHF
jgi:hypothetical protein